MLPAVLFLCPRVEIQIFYCILFVSWKKSTDFHVQTANDLFLTRWLVDQWPVVVFRWIRRAWSAAPPAGASTPHGGLRRKETCPIPDSFERQLQSGNSRGNMGEKAVVEMVENTFELYFKSVRQQLEEDPVFLIGVIVALAVVVITCGKKLSLAC